MLCGRGSSGHVGVYLRYLFETRSAFWSRSSAPSVITTYRRPPDMRETLFIVISQSGRSPDLVLATESRPFARRADAGAGQRRDVPGGPGGALGFADRGRPGARRGRDQDGGSEMLAGAQLVAALARDDG